MILHLLVISTVLTWLRVHELGCGVAAAVVDYVALNVKLEAERAERGASGAAP